MAKTAKQLESEIEFFLGSRRHPSNRDGDGPRVEPRFVVLGEGDEGDAKRATDAQLAEFCAHGTVNGSKAEWIGVRYLDSRGNDVAEGLDQAELCAILGR